MGTSHIRPLQDGLRFLLIIFKVGTLYSPLKIFLPFSLTFFLTGLGYYLYTLFSVHRFTNMSALLFITSVLIFLIGLVSEQITNLLYRPQA
jgi:predicted PurR-regulated permease PerM